MARNFSKIFPAMSNVSTWERIVSIADVYTILSGTDELTETCNITCFYLSDIRYVE